MWWAAINNRHPGSPLPYAKDDAGAGAQQVLFVALAIGQLSAKIVSLDGTNGNVSIDGQVEPSSGHDRTRARRPRQRTAGSGEQPVEAVSDADKPLHKGGEFSTCETVAEARP